MIEAAILQNVEALRGLDTKQIRDRIESVVYDHRDHSVRATVMQPTEPDADTDSAKSEVPVDKHKRRNALKPA